MAERVGFEPTRRFWDRLPDFESGSFDQLRHLSHCIQLVFRRSLKKAFNWVDASSAKTPVTTST